MSEDLRAEFPFFGHHPGLVYLDSAATTPMPRPVIEAVHRHLTTATINPGRGSYRLAGNAATAIEEVRGQVAAFLNAPDCEGIAFTSGTTAALNALTRGWAAHALRPGDEILLSPADHAATTGPWHALAATLPVRLVSYKLTPSGDPDVADIAARVTSRTRAAVITHVHNVYGERASVAEIRRLLGPDVIIVLDAAQSIGHFAVDVRALGADAVAFSAHKMFGPPGTGVLYLAPRLRQAMTVTAEGGVSANATGLARVLERGTPNTAGIAGLGAAIGFLTGYGLDRVHAELSALTRGLVERLRALPGTELLPGVAYSTACTTGYGIVSFRLAGISFADAGFIFDDAGICVRTGTHCARQPGPGGDSIRISAHAYTTPGDLDRACQALAWISGRRPRN